MSNRVVSVVVFLCILCVLSPVALAKTQTPTAFEKLAAFAPGDTVALVGTSGSDELKPLLDQTSLYALWQEPTVQAFVTQIKDTVLEKIGEDLKTPEDQEQFDLVCEGVRLFLSRPMVAGVGHDFAAGEHGDHLFLILDAGERKAEFENILARVESMLKPELIEQYPLGEKNVQEDGPR